MRVIETNTPLTKLQGHHVKATDPTIFYNDLPNYEQTYWFSQLQTHSLPTFESCTTGASWKTIPSSYLICEQDAAIPARFQEIMANTAEEKGAHVDLVRLNAGHSPFLSKPKETVTWIRGVAGEEISV